jgi:hypothetical protein
MRVVAGVCAGIFAGALGCAPANAQSMYKCTDPQGRNSYQHTPCRDHEQQVWTRELPTASVPAPPNAAAAGTKSKATPSGRSARSGSKKSSRPRNGSTAISLHRDPAACEKAKEQRRKTYEKLGATRGFQISRDMDNLVHQACR